MATRQPELGKRIPFSARAGIGGHPPLRGMNKQSDPASVPTYQFQHLENVQIRGGKLVSRGGQSKFNSGGTATGCLYGIGDLGEDLNMKLYGTADTGNLLVCFDTTQSPLAQLLPDLGDTVTSNIIFFDGALWFGTSSNEVWKMPLPKDRTSTIVTSAPPEKVYSTGVSSAKITNLEVHAGEVWAFMAHDTPASSVVYSWDGTTLSAEDNPGVNVHHSGGVYVTKCLRSFREDLFAVYSGTVRRLNNGTWSTVTAPIAAWETHDIIVYKDKLYISVYDTGAARGKVMVWDGSSLAVAATFTSAGSPADTRGFGMFVWSDTLYVNWVKRFDVSKAYFATFDGSTWTNEAIQLAASGSNLLLSNYWIEYRGRLYYAKDGHGVPAPVWGGWEASPPGGLWSASAPNSSFAQESGTSDYAFEGLCIG